MNAAKTSMLLDEVIATGAGGATKLLGTKRTFHAFGLTSAGAGASTIDIEVSNDGVNFLVIDTLSLTLNTTITAPSQDVYEMDNAWVYVRGNVKTLTGTDATVSLVAGVQVE